MYYTVQRALEILTSGSWYMSESLPWSPWRNLKYLAGIQKLGTEWVKNKIDLSCSVLFKRLPPFIAALKPELSCFDIGKFWRSWQMPSKIHQAKSRSPPPSLQTKTVRQFAQALRGQLKARQAACSLSSVCPHSPFNCLSIRLWQWRHCGQLRMGFYFVLLEWPCTEKITSFRIQWIFPLWVLLDRNWLRWHSQEEITAIKSSILSDRMRTVPPATMVWEF